MKKVSLVVLILIIMMLFIGCDRINNIAPGYVKNNRSLNTTTTVPTQSLQVSEDSTIEPPKAEPYPMVTFAGYEQLAQAIRTDRFFIKGNYDDEIVRVMSNTDIIRLKVDGKALNFEQGSNVVYVYQPPNTSFPHGYMARHIYMDNLVFYQVGYQELYTKFEAMPNLTHDAVINGENVKVNFSALEDGKYCASFDYKDMYRVAIFMDDQEILDYIVKHLTIEEISVK